MIFDTTDHMMSPMVTGTRVRGTELLDWKIARALREAGHRVDVVTSEKDEHFVEGISFWPRDRHPTKCDVLIIADDLSRYDAYRADRAYVSLNRIDPILAGHAGDVDAFVTLSDNHSEVLLKMNAAIAEEQCRVIGPGVDAAPIAKKEPGTMLWSNSHDRGLIHLARIWDDVLKEVPNAKLFITYGLESYVQSCRWRADQEAIDAMEMLEWAENTPSVTALSRLTKDELVALRAQTDIYPYPCVPLMPGSIVHAFAVQEALAAGCQTLLSDADGLPSVFGNVATIVGRGDDHEAWVGALVEATSRSPLEREKIANAGRRWAKKSPWSLHAKMWRDLVEGR